MRRFLAHLHRHSHSLLPPPPRKPSTTTNLPFLLPRCLLSSDASPPETTPPPPPPPAADVSNSELKKRLEAYFAVNEETELPSVAEAVLERKLAEAHSDTDDDLIEELRSKPRPEVSDFESDFEDMHDTDEELNDLYNAREFVEKKFFNMNDTKGDTMIRKATDKGHLTNLKECEDILEDMLHWDKDDVEKKIKRNKFLNMDDTKWDAVIKKAMDKGHLTNLKECEDILEDMLHWDKLLPDEIKQKVEAKFNELGDMCERGEMEPEQAYELFKEFEDKMVEECSELIKTETPTDADELAESGSKKVELDDPPGEGPVLRWETRIVFAPSGDAYHPKNRKVKLSVTVKELGLSRHAFRRFREIVGKRYNSGKDELTIISERFEQREENRKDCLRTLYTLIEDAMKADKLVEDARNAYVKGRLKGNSQFMERLKRKTDKLMAVA